MYKEDFFSLVDNICGLPPSTIIGNESLADFEHIDSLAMLGLIAMLDSKFDLQIKPDDIKAVGTINDLYAKISE